MMAELNKDLEGISEETSAEDETGGDTAVKKTEAESAAFAADSAMPDTEVEAETELEPDTETQPLNDVEQNEEEPVELSKEDIKQLRQQLRNQALRLLDEQAGSTPEAITEIESESVSESLSEDIAVIEEESQREQETFSDPEEKLTDESLSESESDEESKKKRI